MSASRDAPTRGKPNGVIVRTAHRADHLDMCGRQIGGSCVSTDDRQLRQSAMFNPSTAHREFLQVNGYIAVAIWFR